MVSFRNHSHIQLDFGPGINVIWGKNGSGKTSILEAVYLLAMGRSFRTNRLTETVKKNDSVMHVVGNFNKENNVQTIAFSQTKEGRRKIRVNGAPVQGARDIIGKNPVVLLSPEEQVITKGRPADRRAFFDKFFSTISPAYLKNLSAYTHVLKQRNALLKEDKKTHKKTDFSVWNEPLAKHGAFIWKERGALLQSFRTKLAEVSGDYDNHTIKIELHVIKTGKDETWFLEELDRCVHRDKALGWTSVGPHRDDVEFAFNGQSLREFGSQGEHKLALVLIKLAEFHLTQNITGQTPTLLLDDLFAKLDMQRSEAVLDLLNRKTQTLITNTDLSDIERRNIDLNYEKNRSFYLDR